MPNITTTTNWFTWDLPSIGSFFSGLWDFIVFIVDIIKTVINAIVEGFFYITSSVNFVLDFGKFLPTVLVGLMGIVVTWAVINVVVGIFR